MFKECETEIEKRNVPLLTDIRYLFKMFGNTEVYIGKIVSFIYDRDL